MNRKLRGHNLVILRRPSSPQGGNLGYIKTVEPRPGLPHPNKHPAVEDSDGRTQEGTEGRREVVVVVVVVVTGW